ncbi:MAG TPA: YbaK/EbsC family protein [Thermomicrobiales bacterium]|nr:YbaK/EbsC family protein [Thermomicrobiales bacterium]
MKAFESAPGLSPLERAIADGKLDAELVLPGVPTPTVKDAARALGVSESQILKSLLFVAPDGQVVLAVACGPSRVDHERLARANGNERLRLAPPEIVLERSGYPAGATPPVCHATRLDVIIDAAVMRLSVAFAGGGRIDALLRIAPREIVRAADATIAEIAVPNE